MNQMRQTKREVMNEHRFAEIERENRILLEKMSNIMQKPKPSLYNPKIVIKPSMNREIRRKELIKITIENQAILKRLQAKGATYSVEKWEKDFEKSVRYRQ